MKQDKPILYIVIPCYNEGRVLPITSNSFIVKLKHLMDVDVISTDSRILFVDDGSSDSTWEIIEKLADENPFYCGIKLSRNRGHQNALLAGLMTARSLCDITVSIDCDGQDDINAIDQMVEKYLEGNEIVYGVRSKRETDTFFKRFTAESFYKLLRGMGAEVVFNHADYRLISSRVLDELANFSEVNLFLRGLIPLVGFKSCVVTYERHERLAGESHYPLKKMLSLALDGITSLSIKPIRMVTMMGGALSVLSFLGVLWVLKVVLLGAAVPGWGSMLCVLCFVGGIQMMSLGIIGEYVGKIYLETKSRPRFIIEKKTW